MDELANKTAYGSAEWRRARSGARLGLVALGLLFPAYILFEARVFISGLAATRVVATAILSPLHGGSEVQLQRAFAAAKAGSPAAATLEPDRKPALHGVTYYLSVTADTPERAKADLATLTDALRAAFPSAERNLMVSLNNSTVPAPNELSRRISFGVQAAVVLLMLGAQILIVIGGHREGYGRTGLFAAMATPFIMLLSPITAESTAGHIIASGTQTHYFDWRFTLLLLALTPGSMILGLWLTRRPRRAASHQRRRA
jgi:hypothetical protein